MEKEQCPKQFYVICQCQYHMSSNKRNPIKIKAERLNCCLFKMKMKKI